MDKDFNIQLDIYKGPMDLLLHLIKEEEIDIYDIPISRITDAYLKHLQILQDMDFDNVGDFIVMAAMLMDIKAKMLLPVHQEEAESEDPRDELVQSLLEYKKFKDISQQLNQRLERRIMCFPRIAKLPSMESGATIVPTIERLVLCFSNIVKSTLLNLPTTIKEDVLPINVYISKIMSFLKNKIYGTLDMLFTEGKDEMRTEKVSYFLSILEMANQKKVCLFQIVPFGKIFLRKK
jgi:segregation and condensation protein A